MSDHRVIEVGDGSALVISLPTTASSRPLSFHERLIIQLANERDQLKQKVEQIAKMGYEFQTEIDRLRSELNFSSAKLAGLPDVLEEAAKRLDTLAETDGSESQRHPENLGRVKFFMDQMQLSNDLAALLREWATKLKGTT